MKQPIHIRFGKTLNALTAALSTMPDDDLVRYAQKKLTTIAAVGGPLGLLSRTRIRIVRELNERRLMDHAAPSMSFNKFLIHQKLGSRQHFYRLLNTEATLTRLEALGHNPPLVLDRIEPLNGLSDQELQATAEKLTQVGWTKKNVNGLLGIADRINPTKNTIAAILGQLIQIRDLIANDQAVVAMMNQTISDLKPLAGKCRIASQLEFKFPADKECPEQDEEPTLFDHTPSIAGVAKTMEGITTSSLSDELNIGADSPPPHISNFNLQDTTSAKKECSVSKSNLSKEIREPESEKTTALAFPLYLPGWRKVVCNVSKQNIILTIKTSGRVGEKVINFLAEKEFHREKHFYLWEQPRGSRTASECITAAIGLIISLHETLNIAEATAAA